jgi:CheY-like chemotaxis protein
MTAILGFTDILLGNVAHPESVEAAKTIQRNGAFLLEIIDDILDLSKIEAGKLELEQVACSPRQILADVLVLMRVRADAKGLGLEVAYEGPLPATVVTDPTRLRQILVNLVGNAIKFTETGSVRVVVQLIEGGRGQPMLRFDVIDTGIGINGDRVAKLFTPFTQGDSSMHRRYGGSGLGLTISKRLAEMLGGTITVASQPGVGSTFSATITPGSLDHMPLLAEVEHARETPASATVPPRTPTRLHGRVLLVEDGPDNQRLISFLLKKAGAEVTLAENGKVALEKALSVFPRWRRRHTDQLEEFDVILMDMQMPVMDGYEATRRLRSAGYRGPIIALTAHAMTDDRQKCLDAGCDDYITKPVNREQLLTVLAASLARLEAAADDHDEGAGEDSLELASEWDS